MVTWWQGEWTLVGELRCTLLGKIQGDQEEHEGEVDQEV